MIMDPMMAENYITQADVRLIYTSVKKHTITSKHVNLFNLLTISVVCCIFYK